NNSVKESLPAATLRRRPSRRAPNAKTAGLPPPFAVRIFAVSRAISAQQLQDAGLRLVGERERGDRDRLAGRQRLAVGRFLVGVGQRQVRRTRLQHVDQVLVEVLTDLHDREVRTERGSLRAQRGGRRVQRRQRLVGRRVVQE